MERNTPDSGLKASGTQGPLALREQAFISLQHRDFRLLWLGLVGALTGYWLQLVAQGWLVLELTDSPFLLGMVTAAGMLPMLFLSLPGGVLADRVDRRKLLILTRSLFASLIFLLAFLTSMGWVNVWHIFAIALLSGTTWAFDLPARQALIPELVGERDLMNAISLTSAVMNGSRIIGPGVAGVLVGLIGEGGCFYLSALGNVGLVFALVMMQVPSPRSRQERTSMAKDLVEGLRYISRHSNALALIVLSTGLAIFGWAYFPLMPVFARDVLGGDASDLGILMVASGVGALTSALVLAFAGDFKGKGFWMLGGALLLGIAELLFALSRWYAPSLGLLMAVGAGSTAYLTITSTLLFLIVPEEYHGRMMSVYMITWGLSVVGSAWAGALAEAMGAPFAVGLSGILCVLFTLGVVLVRPKLRNL